MGRDEHRRAALAMVAPGTALRDGLERIVRGSTGALVVVGCDPVVQGICSGGFELNTEFSATRLRELAKMDGAVVLDQAARRILRAAVQLMPDPRLPTQESGTRHRTAERTARQTGFPVITVSKSMRTIAVFAAETRYVLEDSAALLARAHLELDTLERYRRRLDDVMRALTALEIEDRATVADIALVAQQLEMVSRVADEIAGYLIELGTDAGLLSLQLDELTVGARRQRELLLHDYEPDEAASGAQSARLGGGDRLAALSPDALADLAEVAAVIGFGYSVDPGGPVSPRGYRVLGQIPRLPPDVGGELVRRFGGLQKLLSASAQDLRRVPGLDATMAATIRDGLSRVAEAALIDRYP
jgi:diadenylate cyclase